ncbi:metallophosphoesterase family protein [Lederbergia wuyishanensis]|uniref:Phosphodiesterase n=1 Tax=Lederbergia wuyishanensis TaxID=1347903 RepID=A0ABU0D482_9BACI|nr:metallophosphoesterase [Lederbergia wuyishanensis]MCJ8008193.1 metallophosphoesterase [Lederbergia wuyishanensis]MDQ0343218.1 putative phosphodiesterase [Lederbergia wuyishanensis]
MRIALLGDLHYPDVDSNKKELSAAVDHFFEQYLREFFSIEADFYVSIGDLTHLGLESEFLTIYNYIKQYDINFRAVLGNHDVLSLSKEEICSLIQQPSYDWIETQSALLLFLDTTKEFELHGWGLDQKQWQWLEEQIVRSREKPLFIFAHHPVPETTAFSPNSADLVSFQDIRPLLKKREGLVIYFNGHTHIQDYHRENCHHYIQAGAPICNMEVLLIELNGNEVDVKKVDVRNKELEDSRKILYETLPDFHRP